jgi:hypothetical protein
MCVLLRVKVQRIMGHRANMHSLKHGITRRIQQMSCYYIHATHSHVTVFDHGLADLHAKAGLSRSDAQPVAKVFGDQ